MGNRLVIEAREKQDKENLLAIRDFVNKNKVKYETSGIISPAYMDFPGIKNPILGDADDPNEGMAGEDWYLLDKEALSEVTDKPTKKKYLVNYKLGKVIVLEDVENIFEAINNAESGG